MDFLRKNRRLSFLYDGKPFSESEHKVTETENGNSLTVIYEFKDGLRVTNVARKINKFGAYEWVNWLENTSDKPTSMITELCDCDVNAALESETERKWTAFLGVGETDTKIYAPSGSMCECKEFCCNADEIRVNKRINHIFAGEQMEYTTETGRSSDTAAPFFNIHKNGKGIIFAIGWTAKWRCILNRNTDDIRIRTKVDGTAFRLLGGEKVRTSSIVIMPYEGNIRGAHNLWRRLIKEEFSLVGSGMVAGANGVLDSVGYALASLSSLAFSALVGVIGWRGLIAVWTALMLAASVIIIFNLNRKGNTLKTDGKRNSEV